MLYVSPTYSGMSFCFPATGFRCHLETATKCCQEPAEVLWRENHAHCHRIVQKTSRKGEKGGCKERELDVSSIHHSQAGVSVLHILKAKS